MEVKLNPLWADLVGESKGKKMMALQHTLETSVEALGTFPKAVATPSMLNKLLFLLYLMEDPEELTYRLHPFIIC